MIFKILVLIVIIVEIHSIFCFSRCSLTINGTNTICSPNPTTCINRNPYFLSDTTMVAGYTSLQMSMSSDLTYADGFQTSQNLTTQSCIIDYGAAGNYTYNYNGKLVSTDYISKIYTVTQPHHRIIVRFTIIYIGIWSSNDMLNLYVNDGTLGQNFAIKYDCRDVSINHTQIMCDRSGNRLDCIRDYQFTFGHNNSYLLINFTSLTNQRDSNIMFWNIFDLNVFTKNCNIQCNACILDLPNKCTSCIANYYLDQANNCVLTCVAPNEYSISLNSSVGGMCLVSCPQGYYSTMAKVCQPCAIGCLSCTTSTNCLAEQSYSEQTSLWNKYIIIWGILIILGIILVTGVIYKIFTHTKTNSIANNQLSSNSQVEQIKFQDSKLQQSKLMKSFENEPNDHIIRIDEQDYGKAQPKRKKVRQQRDKLRSQDLS